MENIMFEIFVWSLFVLGNASLVIALMINYWIIKEEYKTLVDYLIYLLITCITIPLSFVCFYTFYGLIK